MPQGQAGASAGGLWTPLHPSGGYECATEMDGQHVWGNPTAG